MWKVKFYLSNKILFLVKNFLLICLTCPPKPHAFVRFFLQGINFSGSLATAVAATAFSIPTIWKKALVTAAFFTLFGAVTPVLCKIEINFIFTIVNEMKRIIGDIMDFFDGNPSTEDQLLLYSWLPRYVQELESIYRYLVLVLNMADSLGFQHYALYDRAEILSIELYNGIDFLKNIISDIKNLFDL